MPGVAGVAAVRVGAGRGVRPLAGDGLVAVEGRAELLVERRTRRSASPGCSRRSQRAQASSSTACFGSSIAPGTRRSGQRRGRPWCSPGRAQRSRRSPLASAVLPTWAASPSEVSDCSVPLLKAGRLLRELVEAGRRRVQVGEQRRLFVGERCRAGPSSASAGRGSRRAGRSSARGRRGARPRSRRCRPALSMKWTTSSRRLASWPKIASAFVLRSAIVVFWLAEDVQRPACSCWSAGAPARIAGVQVLGVAVERRAELVDQQREAVLERLAQGVLRRGRAGRSVLLRAAGIGAASSGLAGAAGLAVDEVLGDQRLRLRGAARVLP